MTLVRFDDLTLDDDLIVGGDLAVTGTVTASKFAAGPIYFGDTSNANNLGGVTINQAGNDDEIVSWKSSDINHGVTSTTETDTFFFAKKISATNGGVNMAGFSASARAIQMSGVATSATNTRSTAGDGPIYFNALLKSGTATGSMGADKNIAAFADNGTTRFILDSDGDSFQDVGTAWTNFDTHDDIALLNLLSAHVTRPNDPLRENFAAFLTESRDELERINLVHFNDDGHHFVNMSRLAMLNTGAIRQLGRSLNAVIEAVRTNNTALLPATA